MIGNKSRAPITEPPITGPPSTFPFKPHIECAAAAMAASGLVEARDEMAKLAARQPSGDGAFEDAAFFRGLRRVDGLSQ